MNVHQLRCFLAVAEELHFGRAANKLRLTASPVSRMIKDLERELRASLFERRYHEVQLTQAGQALIEPVRELLGRFDDLRGIAAAAADGSEPPLRLGAAQQVSPIILDEVLSRIGERVKFSSHRGILFAASVELIELVLACKLEAALIHLPVDHPDLDTICVGGYRMCLAMRADDPLAQRTALDTVDLVSRDIVVQSPVVQPKAMQRIHDRLLQAGLHRIEVRPDNDSGILQGLVRHCGQLVVTRAPCTGGVARVFEGPDFAVVPMRDTGLTMYVGLVWKKPEITRNHLLNDAIVILRETLAREPLKFIS
jgi:DNA-binding transcriptional LysR family regulator